MATHFDCREPVASILEKTKGTLIPHQDVVQAIKFILSTSNATSIKEINMPAMKDMGI